MLLEAALNGARDPAEHPALPVIAAELASEARASVAAGAGAIHLHVRDAAGAESLAAGDVARVLRSVRSACPGVPVGIRSGAWIVPDPARRSALVAGWTALPDFVSVNFDEAGAGPLAELLIGRGIGVEAGLSSIAEAQTLVTSSATQRCVRVLLEPPEESRDAALRMVAGIEGVLDSAGIAVPRLLHGFGQVAWELVAEAARRGYDSRIGLEDTLTLPDGRLAPGNAALVREARRIVATVRAAVVASES